jgi:glycosyltransferase involved in cell wall biosynthesis
VCVDCRYIRERPSGIGVWVQVLVDYLPGLAPDLHFLFMKHPKGPERLSPAPNVSECVVPQEANGPATMFWLPRIVDLRGVDLYHNTFGIMPHGMPIPTVVSVPDIMQITHPSWAKGPEPWGWIEVAFKWHGVKKSLRDADLIIAVSEATRKEIASVDPAAAARTRVALQGVSEDFHPLQGSEGQRLIEGARRRYVHGAPRFILTIGQFSIYKNHERVLRAFAQAFGHEPDMHLVFVQRLGRGPSVLRPIARELGVDARVHFIRDVPLLELVALYNSAVALCHPSLYEGFGNPVSEAIACGCPVITSNRVSMPEVAGGSALLVEPEDIGQIAEALRRIAEEPELAASLRTKGLARAAQLTWKPFAERHVEAYREVLARR